MNENINNENNYNKKQNFYNNQINIINQEKIKDIKDNKLTTKEKRLQQNQKFMPATILLVVKYFLIEIHIVSI